MPVPQENSLFVEQASFVSNRQDACSTRKFTLCGTGILFVYKSVVLSTFADNQIFSCLLFEKNR